MGGRRKKRKQQLLRPKPKVPNTFECPRCGKVAITVEIKNGIAKIKCGNCGLEDQFEVPPVFDEANAYGKFIDRYFEGKIEIKEKKNEENEENETQGESEEDNNGSIE